MRAPVHQVKIADKIENKNCEGDQEEAAGLSAESLPRWRFGRLFLGRIAHAYIFYALDEGQSSWGLRLISDEGRIFDTVRDATLARSYVIYANGRLGARRTIWNF